MASFWDFVAYSIYFINRRFQVENEQTDQLIWMPIWLKRLYSRWHSYQMQRLGQFSCWYTNFGYIYFRLLNQEWRVSLEKSLKKSLVKILSFYKIISFCKGNPIVGNLHWVVVSGAIPWTSCLVVSQQPQTPSTKGEK